MAGNYTRHQQKIINRYYENLDTITLQKLGEIVSELYLAEAAGEKKKLETLWKRADTALAKSKAKDAQASRVVEQRDVKGLATLVGKLSS